MKPLYKVPEQYRERITQVAEESLGKLAVLRHKDCEIWVSPPNAFLFTLIVHDESLDEKTLEVIGIIGRHIIGNDALRTLYNLADLSGCCIVRFMVDEKWMAYYARKGFHYDYFAPKGKYVMIRRVS